MFARQPSPLWVVMSVFAVSVAAVSLAGRWLRPPVALPRTLAESIERLSSRQRPFHAVLVMECSPEAGFYVCERPLSRNQLQLLPRAPEFADRWRGVVYCERTSVFSEIAPEHLRSWGEHSMTIGPLLFFGDPALLRRIYMEVLPQAQAEP